MKVEVKTGQEKNASLNKDLIKNINIHWINICLLVTIFVIFERKSQ